MPSDSRFSAMTRRGEVALQVIPCQPQKSRDVLLHEAKAPAGAKSWDLKQMRACLSFSVSSLMAKYGRLQKKQKRQRNLTRPGDKAPKDVITV